MALNEPVLEQTPLSHSASWGSSPAVRRQIDIVFALILGAIIWQWPPAPPIDARGMQFLATLAVAVVFWVRESFDEYVVGLMLLFSWTVAGIVPSSVALSGFSKSSWLFVIAALGIGAGVHQSGLLSRVATQLLRCVPVSFHRTHVLMVLISGMLTTPLLPTGKARTVIGIPVGQAIAVASGFAPGSNGSAALTLAALVGFSQLSFMFLTGGEFCLIGWNLMPGAAKAEFGWTTWFVAALPAGLFTLLFVFVAAQWFFPLRFPDKERLRQATPAVEMTPSPPLRRAEWIVLVTLTLTILGWLTMPLHGLDESWIALAALLSFHATGVLNKETFVRKLDWGLILFFGIVSGMAAVTSHLGVDRWFIARIEPILGSYASGPLSFLSLVVLLVTLARFFIRKAAAVAFFMITLLPLSHGFGVHPGVLLLTVVMASESFLLAYQDGPYQIAYSSTNGQSFSHSQARKLLLAKSLGTLLAIIVSVPYWRLLGLID